MNVVTYAEYKNEYRNKRIQRWLSADIPSYRFVLQIENETEKRP